LNISILKNNPLIKRFFLNLPLITKILVGVWFGTMTAVPIAIWSIGEQTIPMTMLLGTLCQAAVVVSILVPVWGWPRTLLSFLAVGLMGWLAEFIGTATGLPFGHYFYTPLLQPQIARVPLLVPIAWFILLPACWRLAEMIYGHDGKRWIKASIAAFGMLTWDLLLDPQMVKWGFWVWENIPDISWFGIPFLNYFGWFIVSFLMTFILNPPSLENSGSALWLVFAITWFLETFGLLFFWGLPGPAIGGGLIMGGLMAWALWNLMKKDRTNSYD
jgi:uncharacterized membrane protein